MPNNHPTGTRGTPTAELDRDIKEALASRNGTPGAREEPRSHIYCYACELEAGGSPDDELEGEIIEVACWRHSDPTPSHSQEPPRHSHSTITHVIQGDYGYGQGWEDLTAATTRADALARLHEYRENEPGISFRWIRRREREAPVPKKPAPPVRKKPATRVKQAHATRGNTLDSYRNLVKRAIANCSKHPRQNHSLFECVFEEVNGGMPYPTPQMRRILEDAVHAARPGNSAHAREKSISRAHTAGNLHARKKKLNPHEAKQRLKTAGLDFSSDFHQLSSSQKDLLLDSARAAGYLKRKGASGSTGRMYFQYLARLK